MPEIRPTQTPPDSSPDADTSATPRVTLDYARAHPKIKLTGPEAFDLGVAISIGGTMLSLFGVSIVGVLPVPLGVLITAIWATLGTVAVSYAIIHRRRPVLLGFITWPMVIVALLLPFVIIIAVLMR